LKSQTALGSVADRLDLFTPAVLNVFFRRLGLACLNSMVLELMSKPRNG